MPSPAPSDLYHAPELGSAQALRGRSNLCTTDRRPYTRRLLRRLFPNGASGPARTAEIVGGFKGKVVKFTKAKLDTIGEAVWKGKVFYREQRILRNRLDDLVVLKPLLGDDIGKIKNRKTDGKDAWLLFPANLYCGQSLLDGRRESIIIDYAFTDDVPGYRPMPDAAGRNGLKIRDEIRMMGRASISAARI